MLHLNTVDSPYLDPTYLNPITYVELILGPIHFPYIFIVFPLRMYQTTFKSTLRYLAHHFQSLDIFSTFLLLHIWSQDL